VRDLIQFLKDRGNTLMPSGDPHMPSPFPGVDPYIEAQGYWQGFHSRFVTYCGDALNEVLPEHYVADLGENVDLMDISRNEMKKIIPDVLVSREGRRSIAGSLRKKSAAGTALLEPIKISLPQVEVEVRSIWIEIRRIEKRVPVAVIEVLSPTNKTGDGFYEYNRKRRATIRQKVHLVELDLLLKGHRLPMDRPLPVGDFYALVSRWEERPQSDVYSWTIRNPLPSIPIPLSRPDPDVMLDLASVFATAYDRCRFARRIDYSIAPTTVKKPADRAWAERTAKAIRG
jgi:hypothetical protein